MWNRESKLILSTLSLFLLIFVYLTLHNQVAFSIPPSFSRQEIIDQLNDWQPLDECPRDNPIIQQLYSSPDIEAASYYSDGKTLNGSIILSNSSENFFSRSFQNQIGYRMVVQPSSVYNSPTGHAGVYADEIYSNYSAGQWVRWVYEKFSNGINRPIYSDNNYEGFFSLGNMSLSFSLDLRSISSPTEYLLNFATFVGGAYEDNKWCNLVDNTDWYQIPIPQFTISSKPNSIELRPGEQKNVELLVTSPLNRAGLSNATLIANSTDEVKLFPEISKVSMYGRSSSSTTLNIKALENLTDDDLPTTHTILISASISIPNFTQYHGGPNIKSNSLTNKISATSSDLTISILKRLTFEEEFTGFWNAYGSLISLIGGGFAAGFTALIFDRIKKKKRIHRKQYTQN